MQVVCLSSVCQVEYQTIKALQTVHPLIQHVSYMFTNHNAMIIQYGIVT